MEQKPERSYTLGEAAEILGVTSPWLTLEEAARYVRAGDGSTIRAAVRYGDLPAYLYGKRSMRFKKTDLDAWLEQRSWEP